MLSAKNAVRLNDILKLMHNGAKEKKGTNMREHQDISTEIADLCLRELVQKRRKIVESELLNAAGIRKKEKRKEIKCTPEFQEKLQNRLDSDETLNQYLSDQYRASGEFRIHLEHYRIKHMSEEERLAFVHELNTKWDTWCEGNVEALADDAQTIVENTAAKELEEALKSEELYIRQICGWNYHQADWVGIDKDTLEDFVATLLSDAENWMQYTSYANEDFIENSVVSEMWNHLGEMEDFLDIYSDYLNHEPFDVFYDAACGLCVSMEGHFSEEKIWELIKQNPHYRTMIEEMRQEELEREKLHMEVLHAIPENVTELFPMTRKIHRHFILHIGPTNSGKTHEALSALRNAESGVYLAPLRLMAYEAYETLLKLKLRCDMVTGEEEIRTQGAKHTAMTVELADLTERYDVAVIDEAQMIADPDRGGAWTAAILGLQARTIHICMAPEAESVIIELIRLCGDPYDIIRYERKTTLRPDFSKVSFPNDIQRGDACIVFSKAKVLACAAELQAAGKSCSVIYGDLPYESRHNEVKRFASGETDVIVSTDAIGMGMNIPIRRVIFLKMQKYDGKTMRRLTAAECKQIAGRAGRFGLYDEGLYSIADADTKRIQKLQDVIDSKVSPLAVAYLSFPKRLLQLDRNFTDILDSWQQVPLPEPFRKQNTDVIMQLASFCEQHTLDKMLIYNFAATPFNLENPVLYRVFCDAFQDVSEGNTLNLFRFLPVNDEWISADMPLNELEDRYRLADLLYNLFRKTGQRSELSRILSIKKKISEVITEILKKQALKPKKCKYCGRTLQWNYPYSMCERCHEERYPRYNPYGDFEDYMW